MNANPNIAPVSISASPAAGTAAVLTVPQLSGLAEQAPPEIFWRIEAIGLQLVTSAAVANRNPNIVIADAAGHQIYSQGSAVAVTASSTAQLDVVAADTPGAAFAPSSGAVAVLVIPRLWLPSGYTVTIGAVNLQAADQISNVSALVSQLS